MCTCVKGGGEGEACHLYPAHFSTPGALTLALLCRRQAHGMQHLRRTRIASFRSSAAAPLPESSFQGNQ